MDTPYEEETHQWVEDAVTLHEMDPGPPIGQGLESMLSLRARPQRLADCVVLRGLIPNDIRDVFPLLGDSTAEGYLGTRKKQ
jgi:hypothetical protein